MTVHFLNILNLSGLRTVFTTLAHSLWLAVVMALLAGIVIILTNKSVSLLRYKLLTGLFMLFTLSVVYTFYNALTSNAKTPIPANIIVVSGQAEILQAQNMQQQKAVLDAVVSFIETHADIIVSIWFIVICFKCARLISGLLELRRLKKTSILAVSTYWIERMNELAAGIGIVKQVTLLQSSLAKIPMVIGHLKPLILFPIGILNALPADEVEAILLHELAHIKRNDFLVNLLQQFAEIIFFFNPGVLWVSSLIKNERENCCDDIAIGVTNDKNKFIHALVAFQEYNTGLTYATTFPGSKNHLLNRVKRIITNNNKTLNNMEKLILASGIIITSLAALGFSPGHTEVKKETVKTVYTMAISPSVDNATTKEAKSKSNSNVASPKYSHTKNILPQTTADTTSKIHYSGVINGQQIQLTEENGQVKELYVDGKKIPEDQYDKYTTIIERVHKDMKENTAKLKMESALLKQKKEEMEQQQLQEMKEAAEMKEQRELMEQDFSKQKALMEKKQNEMQKSRSQKNEAMMKSQSLEMKEDLIKKQKQLKQKQVEFQKQVEKMKLQQEKLNEMMKDSIKTKRITKVRPAVYSSPVISVKPKVVAKSQVSAKPSVSVKSVAFVRPVIVTSAGAISSVVVVPVAMVTPVFAVKPAVYITSNSTSDEIIRDLEKANIISTRNNLSFRLTNNELIVNGVKQTNTIHQNILKKYIRKPGDIISLSYSNQQ